MKSDRIAVIMKDDRPINSLPLADTVAVFAREDAGWIKVDKHYVNLPADFDAALLRAEIRRLARELGACRICAGLKISGVLYHELDRLGFSIFEIPECSGEILDGILRDIDEENTSVNSGDGCAGKPVQTDTPGVYFFDLQKLQAENPEISSKQALKEFLETVPFYALQLICAHIPPWLKSEVYDIHEEQTADGKNLAIITKKQCGGD